MQIEKPLPDVERDFSSASSFGLFVFNVKSKSECHFNRKSTEVCVFVYSAVTHGVKSLLLLLI